MDFQAFAELARSRRTIRRFKRDPIPDEYVQKILEAARWAPSGANSQPWEFMVIKDQEVKQKIEDLYNRMDNTRDHIWETTRREDLKHWASIPVENKLSDAPVVIVPMGDIRTVWASAVPIHFMYPGRNLENMTTVTVMIHLAATALGLGARWVSIEEPTMPLLKSLLGIPEIFYIYSIIPIGYPAYKPVPAYRRDMSEILHYDGYDKSKYRTDENIIEYVANLRKRTRPGYAVELPQAFK